jgi:hypothetical protein
MKPARSILPAIDQAIEEANGQRVAMMGRSASLALLPLQVAKRSEPHPAMLTLGRPAPVEPTGNSPGSAATRLACATPNCRRLH